MNKSKSDLLDIPDSDEMKASAKRAYDDWHKHHEGSSHEPGKSQIPSTPQALAPVPLSTASTGTGATKPRSLVATLEQIIKIRTVRHSLRREMQQEPCAHALSSLEARLEAVEKRLLGEVTSRDAGGEDDEEVVIALVGDFSSGKSSLINSIIGEDLCPTGIEPTTEVLSYFRHGEDALFEQVYRDGRRVRLEPGEYRKACVSGVGTNGALSRLEIRYPSEELRGLCLVDTIGMGAASVAEDKDKVIALHQVFLEAMTMADLVVVVLDIAKGGLTKSMMVTIRQMQQEMAKDQYSTPLYLCFSKSDTRKEPTTRQKILGKARKRHASVFERIELVSTTAQTGCADVHVMQALHACAAQMGRSLQHGHAPLRSTLVGELTSGGVLRVTVDGVEQFAASTACKGGRRAMISDAAEGLVRTPREVMRTARADAARHRKSLSADTQQLLQHTLRDVDVHLREIIKLRNSQVMEEEARYNAHGPKAQELWTLAEDKWVAGISDSVASKLDGMLGTSNSDFLRESAYRPWVRTREEARVMKLWTAKAKYEVSMDVRGLRKLFDGGPRKERSESAWKAIEQLLREYYPVDDIYDQVACDEVTYMRDELWRLYRKYLDGDRKFWSKKGAVPGLPIIRKEDVDPGQARAWIAGKCAMAFHDVIEKYPGEQLRVRLGKVYWYARQEHRTSQRKRMEREVEISARCQRLEDTVRLSQAILIDER